MRRAVTLLLMFFLLAFSAGSVFVSLPANGAVQTTSLKVSSLVPVVPADGLSHAVIVISLVGEEDKPVISSSPLEVYLSSSNPGVGAVPTSVTFPATSGFVVVNITTTTTPGTTTVSASAQGVSSGSASVKTALLSGFPTAIEAYPAPAQAAAQPLSNGTIVIELVDNYHDPAEASEGTRITLSSSDTSILNVTSTVFVPPGEALANASYTAGLLIGSATVSLSSPGLESTTVSVAVKGSTPDQLMIQTVSTVPSDSSQLTAAVWLADQSGDPVVAATDVTISLVSSNFNVLSVQPSVTIFAGTSYAEFNFSTGNEHSPIQVKITAAVTGLTSSSVTVTVETPSTGEGSGKPLGSLGLEFLPLLANGGAYQAVYVYLENSSGYPVIVPTCGTGCPGLQILLTSAAPAVASVDSSVTIPVGHSFAIANAYTSFQVGSTQITAVGQYCGCVEPVTGDLKTYGQIPSAISVQSTPPLLPADNQTFSDLSVQLVSQQGPAIAPNNMLLDLSSSNPSVAEVNGSVYVQQGQSSILVPVKTSGLPGSATITVSGSGLGAVKAEVSTVIPGASGTELSFAPQPSLGLLTDGVGALQLVDGSGNPVIARNDVSVTVTAANQTMLPSPILLTVPSGSNYVTFPLQLKEPGKTTFSATSQGLLSSSSQVQVIVAPVRVAVGVSTSTPKQGEPVTLTVLVTLEGSPVPGAQVTWSSSVGSVSPLSETTGSNGEAQASFVSQTSGAASVRATVSISGAGTFATPYAITVSSSGFGFFSDELPILGLGAAVVAVAIADLVYLRRKRSRKKSILSDVKPES